MTHDVPSPIDLSQLPDALAWAEQRVCQTQAGFSHVEPIHLAGGLVLHAATGTTLPTEAP